MTVAGGAPYKPVPFFYGLIKIVLLIVYRLLFCLEWRGAVNVPDRSEKRGVILAQNHASYLDPPILGVSLKRRVTYLAKEYLFHTFFVGWVLRSIGAFPIKTRSDDFRSIRGLLKILKDRQCVVVFPEGTRSADGLLQEAEGGVGFLALKSRAAVVPVYIQGTYAVFPRGARWPRRGPVRVYYGKPFVPAEDMDLISAPDPYLAVSWKIMGEIKKMKDEVESGVNRQNP